MKQHESGDRKGKGIEKVKEDLKSFDGFSKQRTNTETTASKSPASSRESIEGLKAELRGAQVKLEKFVKSFLKSKTEEMERLQEMKEAYKDVVQVKFIL